MTKQPFQTTLRLIRLLVLAYPLFTFIAWENVPIAIAEQSEGRANSSNSGWESIFFRGINRRARIAKLGNLRTSALRKDDLELRVWIGFGPVALEGFTMTRRGSRWSAIHLRSINHSVARSNYQKKIGPPKSGWDGLWERLVDQGVLTLPGLPQGGWADGESVVVEIKTGRS